jgi:hypothetical protein
MMSARERFKFASHCERLAEYQTRIGMEANRARIIRRREFRRAVAYMYLRRALAIIIADNINLYNRTKNWNL